MHGNDDAIDDDLLQRQQNVVDLMKQLYNNFKKDSKDRKTPDYIKRRLDTLDDYWYAFQQNHNSIIQQGITGDYIDGNQFELTKQFYNQARDAILTSPTVSLIKPPVSTVRESALPTPPTGQGNPSGEPKIYVRQQPPPPPPPPAFNVNKNESKLQEMLKKQTSNFRAFHRTLKNINLSKISEKWEFDDILKNLDSRWAAIDKLHWDIDSERGAEIDDSYESVFTEYEGLYSDMKKQINSKLWSAAHREKSTPTLDIPIFHGNYQQWTSFKDLFTEAIHSNPCLSNAQKMQFLKSKLKGEPERLIQHLPISSDNYITCWEIVNHRYNNKKLIFSNHMNTIMSLPALQQVSSAQIKRLHDVTVECLNGIKNLGVNVDTWDPILIHILAQKLDSETHNDYMASLKEPRELPSLKDFLQFLETKFTTLESSKRKQENAQQKSAFSPSTSNQSRNKYYSSNKATAGKWSREKQISCPVCTKDHGIYFCSQFRDMNPALQRKTVARLEICANCLYSHKGKPCQSTKRCRQCNGSHNTLLHDAFTQHAATEAKFTSNSVHVAQNAFNAKMLATALVQIQASDGVKHTLRAMVDPGSEITLITQKAAQTLKLTRQKFNGVITGIGAHDNACKGVMNITCSSLRNNFTFNTEAFIMKCLTRNIPSVTFSKPSWDFINDLEMADPEFYVSKPIDLILGTDVYATILLKGQKRGEQASLKALETQLGWILFGERPSLQCNVVLNNLEDIHKFWEIEDIGNEKSLSSEDEECIKYYKSTTRRLKDGRYQVRYPLKKDFKLGKSKNKAIAQFLNLERKLSKNKTLSKQYKEFMNEYLALGHMIPAHGNKKPDNYLPQHCVLREESTTTKCRVVANAAAKTSNGQSLNDVMYKGPNLQQDIMDLILRWRQHRIAFVADIEKMFLQVWIHPDDQALQKVVWRDSPDQLIREFQLTKIIFGSSASPWLAMMTLKQLASDERSNYPEAAQVVDQCFYMDDLLHGADNLEKAEKLKQDLIQLMKSGGFNLRKWRSNNEKLQENNKVESAENNNYTFMQPESTKTLGLNWEPTRDIFTFQSKISEEDAKNNSPITKRKLLSDISKLFDPLGWLTPVSTKMKLLFQSVWKNNIQWDDKLPDDVIAEWSKIKQNIPYIEQVAIPRWLGTETGDGVELHGFCDASQKAYACVIYCKTNNEDGQKITLLAGKSRLVPSKKDTSLPKLELCGAHLLAKLMKKVSQNMGNRNIKMYGWVDSTAVLGWIQGDPARWKIFVANRVRQITEVMPAVVWRYVKSAENPADCASRGLTALQLQEHDQWWQGPEWLPSFKEKDQESQPLYFTKEEVKAQVNAAQLTAKNEPSIIQEMLSKYSSFTKVVHVLAWIRRFLTRKQDQHNESYLTLPETRQAKALIIQYVQQQEFGQEIQDLKQGKQVSGKSKLSNLNPFLSEDGILRLGGRLRNAHINPDMKHPIILPHSGKLTELIIEHAHQLTFHGGARVTHAFIRQKYWILGGNNATKKHVRRCVICKRQKPAKQHQLMGDLPEARINPSRAFSHVGVDFTGHVFIKANKGRGIKTTKAYVAVFCCMVSKGVHLELVGDMTTSSFIAAMRRMAARRGAPRHIYCDNGRNFVGASRCLQQEYQEILQTINDEFLAEMTDMEITWHFNAPAWPSAGGLWEAAVKSFKFHLKRVIGEQKLTYEEFTTLLAQIEACLNSRPLTTLSEDPQELDYLTPAHFLVGGPTMTLIETEKDERTRWKLTQNILQDLWKRWRSEYLIQLAARSKWKTPQRNIEVNDVVLIHEDNLPPGKWALGRVLELHQGKDGYVRVVTIKTKNGIMKRPIVKLSVLLQNSENASSGCAEKKDEDRQTSDVKDNEDRQTSDVTDKHKANVVRTNFRGTNRLSLSSIITTLLLFLSLLTTSHCNINVTQFKEHQSLYFDKMSDMMLIQDEWKLIVYYNLEPYWDGIRAFNQYTKSLQDTCEKIREQAHCDVILLQLRHGFSELQYYNQMLLNQHAPERPARLRRRRGLINGIGSIANSLFGVLDESFAEQYRKDITLIKYNQKHIATLWKNQTSIIEAEYNLLKRAESTMNQQHKLLNQHMNIIDTNLKTLKSEIQSNNILSAFNIGSIVASNMIHNLKEIQTMLLDTITDIYHGRFNIHLLTPNQLIDELSIIASKLPKDVSLPIDNIHTDLHKIYDLLTVRTRLLEEVLIFEIKIPLISRDVYEILKIIPIPIAKRNEMISIIPVSEYISINMKKDVFTPLSEYDIGSCKILSGVYYCQLHKPEFKIKGDRSFCKNNASTCLTLINSCQDDWKETSNMGTYVYFCCTSCQLRTICDDQVIANQLTQAGLINVENNCIIKTDNFTVFPHKRQSSAVRMQPDIFAPSIAPINHLFNLTVPMASIATMNESHEFQQEIVNIGKKIQKLKETDVISTDISYHDIHHYTVIYVIVGIMAIVGIMLTIRKFRCNWKVPRTRSEASNPASGTILDELRAPQRPADRAHGRASASARAPPSHVRTPAPAPPVYARVHTSRMRGIQIPKIEDAWNSSPGRRIQEQEESI